MKWFCMLLVWTLSMTSCGSDEIKKEERSQISFDSEKWKEREADTYPYRESMVADMVYSESIRKLKKEELLEKLGQPSRTQNDHYYYTIAENKLGFWTLNSKTLVIKFNSMDSIEWIKIHQ